MVVSMKWIRGCEMGASAYLFQNLELEVLSLYYGLELMRSGQWKLIMDHILVLNKHGMLQVE